MRPYDVTALGELLIDLTQSGTDENGNGIFTAFPGGAPANVAVAASRLGASTGFIGKVGNDAFGRSLAETLSNDGVNTDGLFVSYDVPTTMAIVSVDATGEREFSFYRNPGADMRLTIDEVMEKKELIENADFFHFGTLSMTHSTVEHATIKAVQLAKDNGCLVSFDPNLRPPLWSDLSVAKEKMDYGFGKCDILKISDDEVTFFGESKGLYSYMPGTNVFDLILQTLPMIYVSDTISGKCCISTCCITDIM